MYLGDYTEDYADLNFKFTTRDTDAAPYTLAGSPVVSVYASNETGTEVTTGVTLSVDFDGVTGLNNVNIDLSADAFYATGEDYSVVITTGTVNGNSVVGEVVATFSIENRFMRGTDGANTTVPDTAGTAAGLHTTTDALIAALNNLSAADVNAQVLDVLNVDTFSEPGQGAPSATPTLRQMLHYLYKNWRNKATQTATEHRLYADDGTTVDHKATVGDDGSTFTKGEMGTGA